MTTARGPKAAEKKKIEAIRKAYLRLSESLEKVDALKKGLQRSIKAFEDEVRSESQAGQEKKIKALRRLHA